MGNSNRCNENAMEGNGCKAIMEPNVVNDMVEAFLHKDVAIDSLPCSDLFFVLSTRNRTIQLSLQRRSLKGGLHGPMLMLQKIMYWCHGTLEAGSDSQDGFLLGPAASTWKWTL